MFDSVKEYANFVKEKVKDTVTTYTAKSDIDKILIEATGYENWNIANSKLQILADACYHHDQCLKILDHLKSKLDSPVFEWRRILKSLHALEYLIKNGLPLLQNDLKYEMYEINNLQNFTHFEEGADKGSSIKQKSHSICDLLTNQQKYEEEIEQAKQYRDKFNSQTGGLPTMSSSSQSSSQYGAGGGNSAYSNQGYGEYAPRKEETTLSSIKDSVGGIVSGAGSILSGGLNYLGVKKEGNSGVKSGGSNMMGFRQ